jgi:hypothetical protein
MKYIITESNLKNLLYKSFSEHGFVETMERMRLTLPQILKIYGDHKLPRLSCVDKFEICDSIINSGSESVDWWTGSDKLMKLKFKRGGYIVSIIPGGYGEVTYFKVGKISTGDSLDGAATPFWNGDCYLPVDVDLYIKKDVINGRPIDVYQRFDLDREFETLKDIIIWLNSEYISSILKVCRPVFEKMEYENKFLDK